MKCSECGQRLNLTNYKTSDFGQKDLFCGKCVPKVAPTQAAESVEMDRAKAASKMTQEVRLVNEQLRLERDRSDGASVRSSGSTDSTANSQMDKPITGSKPSPRLTRLAMGETSSSKTPKCNACGKTAYAAESVNVKEATYHKACFKCHECKTRLTLTTYQVSDFGDHGVYCTKCVPKVAPLQANETVEMERASRAAQMTSEVTRVNEQVRGDL